MSEILCQWLNQDLKVSQTVSPKSFAKAFSNGYLIGEVLYKFELQDDFSEFSESRISSAKLNNFTRLEPTLNRLGVQFDQNIAHSIITEKPGVATKLLYQMYIALQKKKKSGLAGVEIPSVQPLAKLQNMKSEAFRDRLRNLIPRQTDFNLMQVSHRFQEKYKKKEELEHMQFEKLENFKQIKEDQRCVDVNKQRLSKRRQNEIMAQIQAAIIQIPKPAPNRALRALDAQKMMKKKKEAEDVANEIKKFEALIKKDLQAKESASKPSLDASGQTATDLLNTYSDDDYIKKIQKRLEEDAFAREQREKRRRRLLMDQLIAHEAQEEAYREEQLINRLMRQSQQERRIAVQLMHVRHEKEILWQNRIFREKQYEERRLKDFQDALDREAALAKQAKMNSEEQAQREKEVHDQIAMERAQARYEKHYALCAEILNQILDLSTKIADYRMLTNNLIPAKMMNDWKELFFNGKPIYEQASINTLPAKLTGDQLIELEKRDLLDQNDFDDYKNFHGEWTIEGEMADNIPASNNSILGHIIHRLIDKSFPSKVESETSNLPSFALKGCLLGKTFSGKTTVLKFLQKEFPIQVLSIDTLVQEAIQAYHTGEKSIMVHSAEKESEENILTAPQDSGKNAQSSSNILLTNLVSDVSLETEDKTMLSKDGMNIPKDTEVQSSENISGLSVRASLGEKSERLLKKGKSISDILLVSIMVNAINQIPMNQGWILDGFPMTLNQARLLEEALTGHSRLFQQETDKSPASVLAVDPTTSKEVTLYPSAFDFVLLLNISDNCALTRMNQVMDKLAESTLNKTPQDLSQRVAAEKQDGNEDKNLRAQIQHRIVGFLDNWPSLEQWFTEPKNILMPVNAEIDEQSLCQKVKEIFMAEMVKKEDEVKAYLEKKENELKEAVQEEPSTPPIPSPESEKEKEMPPQGERARTLKGRQPSEHQQSKTASPREEKKKKGDPSLKRKGSPKGKSAGAKAPTVKAEALELPPMPLKPPPPQPGSEDWVYVNEPIPEEICSFLVPYWQLIENTYIDNIKTVLRHLRENQHTMIAQLYDIRTNFQRFLRRPDHKQDFVSQWQADFNSLPDDLWDDEETKSELHQRVNDLRDRLWDICDARREEAEQECVDIINDNWLQDLTELTINHYFSMMQAELNRFQDTKRFLQDYYRGMEGKIPTEDSKKFIRVPLIQPENKDLTESQVRLPLVPRISISPESSHSKPKTKIEFSLDNLETNYEADEKLITDTWQQTSLVVSQMLAAEIHQRLEEEKEIQQAEQKERSPPVNINKKGKKESPKAKKEEKKGKGKQPVSMETSPVTLTAEELDEMERRNELRTKIREEHFAVLQFEETCTQFRLQLIKTKALVFLRDLIAMAVSVYKQMEYWFAQRYLKEMASVEKLTEVARYHIEKSTRIQNELYLDQEDFFINGDVKVFPDPLPPKRPPTVEKEENITLTIEQLDNIRDQFLNIAPNGQNTLGDGSQVLEMLKKPRKLDYYMPKRNNQFLKIWLKKYPWLIYDEILNLMFCGLCRKHGVKSRGSQVSLFYGTDNFRTEFLNAHHLSEAHAKASLMEATSGSPVNRATTDLMVRTMSKVTLGRVENLFRSCHAIAKTGRPLKDFIWMCSLDDMKGVDIGPVFRTNRSARTFTYFIAEVERKNLKEKLEKSKFFSIISDGISKGAMEEAELVYIQFALAGKVHCQIVGLQTIEKRDPLTRKRAIERILERNLQLRLSNQDWAKKLVGFGSDDGVPCSEGESNRMTSLLREIQPCVLTGCCFAHHLELSYKTVFHSIPLYNDVRDLLQSIYQFYHNFPLHKSSLISAFRGLHLCPVMPSHVGGRRWLQGLQTALQNFLKGYPAIIQQLHSAEEDKSNTSSQKAKELLQSLLKADIVKFIHFLVDVINVLSILSRVSQNRNSSIADIFATLESTLEMLRIYQTRPGPKERRVNSDIHFPTNCLTGKGNISDVRSMVLTLLIKRLQSCFRDASQDVVKATMIGSFRLWPAKINQGMIGSKTFTDILLDLITLNLGSNYFPNTWMHFTQPDLQELTYSLIVNSEFVDWRKFLLVTSMPWPVPTEEELLETLQRFKEVDVEQSGTITFQQYMQAGLWFRGEENIKIPEDPLEPLPFNRQKHLIEFFFRLFADYEKDPPLLDYTEMLLYYAAHPNPTEGVYRALSVAIGTHVFQPIETMPIPVKIDSFSHVNATEKYSEIYEKNIERESKEELEEKEEIVPENSNTEKISIETLLKVFRGGNEAQDSSRFVNHLRKRNIYLESFQKVFHDLGVSDLEPIEVAALLKHPFIQDLILSYPDYKLPVIKMIFQRYIYGKEMMEKALLQDFQRKRNKNKMYNF